MLQACSAGSRRYLADAIKAGRVSVNGQVVEDFSFPVSTRDRITIDGRQVELRPSRPVYLLLNKPAGIVSTTRDERSRPTVTHLIPHRYRDLNLYPVGRLDKDSTGLILLTNDGRLAYRLTHPKYEYEKEYEVSIDRKLEPLDRAKIESGVELEDGPSWPVQLRVVAENNEYTYSVTLHEGRNRIVRRIFARLGYRVESLKRTRIAELKLADLKEGEVRALTPVELKGLGVAACKKEGKTATDR